MCALLKTPPKASPAPAFSSIDIWIVLLLITAVAAIFGQVFHFDFVTYDDPDYVTANPYVQAGLTISGVAWAFTSSFAGNWFPLTWLSHMLDCGLFGLDAGWHHLTNVLLHGLSTVLLFVALKGMTGSRWKSAMVAFVFAIHPLRAESVVWVAERKDVLSGLFWILTIWSYGAYATRGGRRRYLLTLVLFCLGLMAKPMLVTLPVVLLLLDRWPLRRGVRYLEKIPFFLAAVTVSGVTFLVHQKAAVVSLDLVPLSARIENALLSYGAYLIDVVCPISLAVFYPFPQSLLIPASIAAIALVAVTILAVRAFPKRPYLTVGWLWYVIALLPVIGLIQVGAQSRADRYTYLPSIGLAIAAVWGTAEILPRSARVRIAVATAVCAGCLVLTWIQVSYWSDSITLYRHAIQVNPDNYLAHFNLATVESEHGDPSEAIAQLRETVRIRPLFATAHAELGQLLAKTGLQQDALQELQRAAEINPNNGDTHFRMGSVLGALGRNEQAAAEFAAGLQLQPDDADGHYNFAVALVQTGKPQEAVSEFQTTLRLRPNDTDARLGLAMTLANSGHVDDARAQLLEVLRIKPDFTAARQALGELTNSNSVTRK